MRRRDTDASTYGMGMVLLLCASAAAPYGASDGESYSGGNRPLSSKHKAKKNDLEEESMSHQYRPARVVVRWVMLTVVLCITFSLTAPPAAADSAPRAYVANFSDNSVSVINTGTNQVVGSPITVGDSPLFLALTPNSRFLYVVNVFAPSVSVINTATNTVVQTITAGFPAGAGPFGLAITPDGQSVYVANNGNATVSV